MTVRTPAARPHARRLVAGVASGLLAMTCAFADDSAADANDPAVVPYRPSVSTPAQLSAPGWVELEAGGLEARGPDRGASRASLPYTVKLAFTPDWGVRIGGDAWVRQRVGGASRAGAGDSGIVLKRRFALDDDHALGLEGGVVIPTGRSGLHAGSGQPDYGVNGIYSGDLGPWHVDANLAATRLGAVEPGASRTQWLYALAVSHALGERLGIVGEVSGTRRSGADSARQVLAALSYAVAPRLVLDAGAARSLGGGTRVWQAFAGFTWTAWHLF